MKNVLTLAAVVEVATGLALLVIPSQVGQLLLGAEVTGVAIPVARVLGIALLALSVACWPGCSALAGMLTYGVGATVYLGLIGIQGQWIGPLLWPAVGLHAVLTVLLARTWITQRRAGDGVRKKT